MAEHPPLTWGDLKSWAEDNEVAGDAVLLVQMPAGDHRYVRDLSLTEDNDERPSVLLQYRWG